MSYTGLRSFTLGKYENPGKTGIPPQIGIDRPGEDLPNYPITLNASNYNLCWALCNQTSDCQAWAYGIVFVYICLCVMCYVLCVCLTLCE